MSILSDSLAKLRRPAWADKTWFNALWFQTTWFACVIGREAWLPLSCALIGAHFLLVQSARKEAYNLAPVVAIGITVDTLLSAIGIFDFGGALVPLWLCLLWVAFATTLTRALAFFGSRMWLAITVGGLGVPANYAAGAKLGAVALPMEPLTTAVTLIAVWAVLFPSLYRVSKQRLSGGC